ncbi:8453_t:CDS:2, partial [Funneliformis geosporum]
GIEEDPWILQNDLRSIVDQAIGFASNLYYEEFSHQLKLLQILSQDLLASQVISDKSEIVQNLPGQFKHTFMKPARQMVPSSLPSAMKRKCNKFVTTFIENREIDLLRKLIHDRT